MSDYKERARKWLNVHVGMSYGDTHRELLAAEFEAVAKEQVSGAGCQVSGQQPVTLQGPHWDKASIRAMESELGEIDSLQRDLDLREAVRELQKIHNVDSHDEEFCPDCGGSVQFPRWLARSGGREKCSTVFHTNAHAEK